MIRFLLPQEYPGFFAGTDTAVYLCMNPLTNSPLQGSTVGTSGPDSSSQGEDLIERLLGILVTEQVQTLAFVNAQLAEVRESRIQMYRELLIRLRDTQRRHLTDLEGDRVLAPDYEEDVPPQENRILERSIGKGADITTKVLEDVQNSAEQAPDRSSQLADLYVDLAQLFIHYNMLHSVAIGVRDEPLAGMAWDHMREIRGLSMECSVLMPHLVITPPNCAPKGAFTVDKLRIRAIEQTERVLLGVSR